MSCVVQDQSADIATAQQEIASFNHQTHRLLWLSKFLSARRDREARGYDSWLTVICSSLLIGRHCTAVENSWVTPIRWNLRLWIEGYRHTISIWIFVALTGTDFELIMKRPNVFVTKQNRHAMLTRQITTPVSRGLWNSGECLDRMRCESQRLIFFSVSAWNLFTCPGLVYALREMQWCCHASSDHRWGHFMFSVLAAVAIYQ